MGFPLGILGAMSGPGFGLVKTSLLDYPGLVSAVVFTAGCNLRCPWCQNPGLVRAPWVEGLISEAELLEFLRVRKPVLQGVVVTGGEPLALPGLPALLGRMKSLGYKVKLDTNGTWPQRLASLVPGLVDYLAFDLKNIPADYPRSAGVPVDPGVLAATLDWMRRHKPSASEVRLTWVPGLNDFGRLDEYAAFVGPGLPVWAQAYRPGPVLDPTVVSTRAPTPGELGAVVNRLVELGIDARLR